MGKKEEAKRVLDYIATLYEYQNDKVFLQTVNQTSWALLKLHQEHQPYMDAGTGSCKKTAFRRSIERFWNEQEIK